jgi:hypothetical protein
MLQVKLYISLSETFSVIDYLVNPPCLGNKVPEGLYLQDELRIGDGNRTPGANLMNFLRLQAGIIVIGGAFAEVRAEGSKVHPPAREV